MGTGENHRNSFLKNRLQRPSYTAKDQTLYGNSPSGKQAGELDIKIENEKGIVYRPYLPVRSATKIVGNQNTRVLHAYFYKTKFTAAAPPFVETLSLPDKF